MNRLVLALLASAAIGLVTAGSPVAAPRDLLSAKLNGTVAVGGGGSGTIVVNLHATDDEPTAPDLGAHAVGAFRFEATTAVDGIQALVTIDFGRVKWVDSSCGYSRNGVFLWSDGFTGRLTISSGGATVVDTPASVHLSVTENGLMSLSTLEPGDAIDAYTTWVASVPVDGFAAVTGVSCP